MPSNRHSHSVLLVVTVLAAAIFAFIFWQNRQKKNKVTQQYAELSMLRRGAGSTPEQQKALLEVLSGKRNSVSPEDILSFRGVPYIMFTRSSPPCPACDDPPETFCLFPDGRALVILDDQIRDSHYLSVSRDKQGNADYAAYLHQYLWVGSWSREGVRPRRLVIRIKDKEKFHGILYADPIGIPTLEERVPAVPPENEDEPEAAHVMHQYRAQNIPPETEKFCLMAAPLLDAPEIILPQKYMNLAIRILAEKLRVEEELLSCCRISCDKYPAVLYLSRKDRKGFLYKLTSHGTKTEVAELSPSWHPFSETFLLNADFSKFNDAVQKTRRAIHELPGSDRGNTTISDISFPDENTVKINAKDDPRGMCGSMTTYTFKRRDGRWKLINQEGADC